MPIAVHLCLHYLLGAWAAWSARYVHALHARLIAWPLGVVAALAALLLVPCTTYQFRFYPDHALGYAVDPGLYPQVVANIGPLSAIAQGVYVGALLAGYAAMRYGICHRRRIGLVAPWLLIAAAGGGILLNQGARTWCFGTYSAYWADQALPWSQCTSAWLTLISYFLAAILTSRSFHKILSQQFRSR